MSETNAVKTKQYIEKDLDSMTAEELRHGALRWLQAEAEGQGLGDQQAEKKIRGVKQANVDKLRRKVAALEAQLKGGGQ